MAKKILLVEDEFPIALHESQLLEDSGYTVVTAHKGEAAIQIVNADPAIELVLMDIDLGSGIDGTEAAKQILRSHDLPVIFLTGHTEDEIIKRVEQITSYGIIQKLSGDFILLQAIKMAFRLFETHKREQVNEARLRESENKFRQMFVQHSAMKFLIDPNRNGQIIDVNQAAIDFYGYSYEQLTRMSITDINTLPPDDVNNFMASAIAKEKNVFQFRHRLFDGSIREVEVHSSPIVIEGNTILLSIMRDITHMKEKEQQYELVFNNANESVVIYQDGKTKLFNKKTLEITEYTAEEYKRLAIDDLVHPDDQQRLYEKHQMRMENQISKEPYEYRIITKTGRIKWLRMHPARVMWEGRPASLGLVEDITSRKMAEEKLKITLEEKENLMQELNHRVKNNLYIISSLIRLKDTALGDQANLEDIKHQVDAIQIIHNKLTYTADFKNINFRDYLQDLLKTFFASYSGLRVDLDIDIENIELPTKKAVPLGLITNEIATNAVKYGFIDDETAWFSAALSTDHENQQYVYTLANSGNPFPDDIDFDTTTTLGMRLINGLLAQIDAAIELQRRPNPVFTIRFPV